MHMSVAFTPIAHISDNRLHVKFVILNPRIRYGMYEVSGMITWHFNWGCVKHTKGLETPEALHWLHLILGMHLT